MSRFLNVVLAVIVVLQVFCLFHTNAARILVLFPVQAPSHFILGKTLVEELVNRGHDVTFVNRFGMKEPKKNLKDLNLGGIPDMQEDMKKTFLNFPEDSPVKALLHFLKVSNWINEDALKQPKIRDLLSSKEESFDLVIIESYLNEAHAAFAHHYNCPLIVVSTISSNILVDHIVGNVAPPSFVPGLMSKFSKKMNFRQRVQNTIGTYAMKFVYYWYHLSQQDMLIQKYFENAPGVHEILQQRTALILINSHPSIGIPKPSVPNMIEIGGYHVVEPKPLPKHLKEYLDAAKEGFILFSMGSNLKSTMIPPETRDILLRVFSELPYKILWKFEDEKLPGKPHNVKIEKWLPQNDILVHPNLKLFITHGGLLSTTEAVYHGVPLVGIPVFADQQSNMIMVEILGLGQTVNFKKLSYETLKAAILEVLNNKSYRESAQLRSTLLRDQPMRPLDSAMYWIEYVLRHGYCRHLQAGSMGLAMYKQEGMDVLALFVTIFGLVIAGGYCTVKMFCCRKKDDKQKKKKNE